MSLRIRRGTDAQRTGVTFETGEVVYTTDSKQLWIGDGVTQGGTPLVGSNITGYGLSYDATTKRIEVSGLTADDIDNGINNKFFSDTLAQAAVAPMFTSEDASHTNIQFQYDEELGVINATVTLDGIGLTDIVADTSPQLGGDLSLNGNDITGTGNIDITGGATLTGILEASSVNASTISNGYITLTTNTATVVGNALTFGENDNPLAVTFLSGIASNAVFNLKSLTAGVTSTGSAIEHLTSRGSLDTPLVVQASDALSLSSAWGYDGTGYKQSSIIGMFVDPNGTVATDEVPGLIGFINFVDTNPANYRGMFFNSEGRLTIGRAIDYVPVAELDVNGDVNASLFLAGQQTVGNDFTNGYSFSGTEGGSDTGMFSAADGILKLVSNSETVVTVNTNKTITLAVLTAAPSSPTTGTIAVADGTSWDPASVGGLAYPVFYNGSAWIKMFS